MWKFPGPDGKGLGAGGDAHGASVGSKRSTSHRPALGMDDGRVVAEPSPIGGRHGGDWTAKSYPPFHGGPAEWIAAEVPAALPYSPGQGGGLLAPNCKRPQDDKSSSTKPAPQGGNPPGVMFKEPPP